MHYRAPGDTGRRAWVLNGLGNLALTQGQMPRTLEIYRSSRDLFAELGEMPGTVLEGTRRREDRP